MLPRKIVTKREKRRRNRRKLGGVLIVIGLVIVAFFLSYSIFFEKEPLFISPLSKDQSSSISKLEKKLKEKNISYQSLETSKDLKYIVRLSKNSEAIIDPAKNLDEQLSSLQLILSQLKIEGKTFRRLDFSYQKPVISF